MKTVKTPVKSEAIHLIEKLPEDYSMDEIMSELYFKQQVEEGLRDVREGRAYSHEQIKNMVIKWRKSSGRV
jgi:predicted transcriptional regulator